MSAHVLLNLLNELEKRDKMRGLPSILSLLRNEFNKFNNTRARMLDSIYHMINTLKSHFWHKNVIILSLQPGRVVKAYEYYLTCIATKTFEFFGFLSEARNDTPNLTTCCTNVPNLILLKIGHLCLSFVQVFP